jgi:phosphate:Na+ symporter
MLEKERQTVGLEEMTQLYKSTTGAYSGELELLYQQLPTDQVNTLEISTLINFNRQLFTAIKSYIFGLKDHLLNEEEADQFDSLPGFIR